MSGRDADRAGDQVGGNGRGRGRRNGGSPDEDHAGADQAEPASPAERPNGADRAGRTERAERGGRGRRGSGAARSRATRPESVRSRRTDAGGAPRARRPQRPAPKARRHPAAVLGLSTTRRAAMLAIVVCALVLSIAVPLRTYLGQRTEVEIQEKREADLRAQVEQLEQRKAQLNDPAQVEAEARHRLRYVLPGETPYVVELPGDHDTTGDGTPPTQPARQQPWFESLWNSVTGAG